MGEGPRGMGWAAGASWDRGLGSDPRHPLVPSLLVCCHRVGPWLSRVPADAMEGDPWGCGGDAGSQGEAGPCPVSEQAGWPLAPMAIGREGVFSPTPSGLLVTAPRAQVRALRLRMRVSAVVRSLCPPRARSPRLRGLGPSTATGSGVRMGLDPEYEPRVLSPELPPALRPAGPSQVPPCEGRPPTRALAGLCSDRRPAPCRAGGRAPHPPGFSLSCHLGHGGWRQGLERV